MRDDATPPTSEPLPLAVIVQPDPMLDEQRPGALRMTLTALGAAAVVCLVLYGLNRPEAPQQVAAASDQAQPANALAQNPQPNAQKPTTTGQGAGEQAGQSKTPPAAGGSATSAVGPGARPAPQAK